MHTHRAFNRVPHCRGKKWRPIMSVMVHGGWLFDINNYHKGWLVASSVHLGGTSEWCFPSTFCRLLTARPVLADRTSILSLSLSPLPLHDRPRSTLSADHFQPNSGIIFIDLSPRPVHSHHVIDRGYNGIGARFRQSLIEYCQIFFQAILLLYPSFPSRTNVTNPMWRHLLTLWIRKIRIVKYRSIFPILFYIYLSFRSRSTIVGWI